ncbi:helix-turn-helix domain-containing protein [Streptomyces parvus]|uniref:helix-turn-helix domain-containing protein n=1 Tax=Streptomyces parvus TaxID=66428 RepID=UPI0036519F5D
MSTPDALGSDAARAARAAALLRAAANDLKRNDRAAEADLGLPPGSFGDYVSGRLPITWDLISRAAQAWPLNERDLLPIHNDTPQGLRMMRVKESEASSRIIERGGGPYYEYRDTAMSRQASYRPEWISMLRVVEDDDPDNPLVEWNKGHLLYQFTYFVGPVNYYFRSGGRSHCVPMNTGDSVWGLPFAPHSFTARSADEPAYILALTYGGELTGDAQRELATFGRAVTSSLALTPGDHGAMLRSVMAARLTTVTELADRSGLKTDRVAALCRTPARAEWPELSALAEALGVSVRELLVPHTTTEADVRIQPGRTAPRWSYPGPDAPAYRFTQLAGDPLHPHTTSLAVDVLTARPDAPLPPTYQHQYLYVLGEQPVSVRWRYNGEQYDGRLEPGDSAYVIPGIEFSLSAEKPTELLMLRIGGSATPDVRFALGAMPDGAIGRYIAEDRLWY